MEFDMRGIRQEHIGKRLKIEFTDGEVCEGELLEVGTCDEHASCCGMTFDLRTTNRPEKHRGAFEKTKHPAIWSEIEFVKSFEVLGDAN